MHKTFGARRSERSNVFWSAAEKFFLKNIFKKDTSTFYRQNPCRLTHLSSDTVDDGCYELSAEAEVSAQLLGEFFRLIPLVRQIPLELVHKGDVAHVDVQLDNHPLISLFLEIKTICNCEALNILAKWESKVTEISFVSQLQRS